MLEQLSAVALLWWHNGQLMLILAFSMLIISLMLVRRLQHALHQGLDQSTIGDTSLLDEMPSAILILCQKKVVYANARAISLFRSRKLSVISGYLSSMVDIYIRLVSSQGWDTHISALHLDQGEIKVETSAVDVRFRGKPSMMMMLRTLPEQITEENNPPCVLLEEMPDCVLSFDAQGQVHYANAAAEEHLAVEHDCSVFSLHHEDEVQTLREQILPEVNERGYCLRQMTLLSAEGHERRMSVLYLLDTSGKGWQYTLLARDIQNILSHLHQRQRMEKAETMSRLAGGVAHELNNALMVILGNVVLARQRVNDTAGTEHCLQRIDQSARQTSQLCHQMLSYAGRGHMEFAQLDIHDWVEQSHSQIRRMVPSHIDFQISLCEDHLIVRGDYSQMLRALGHVLKNAYEAMSHEGGRIMLSSHKVSMSSQDWRAAGIQEHMKTGHYACLSVRDNGCGMASHVLEHMFDPFFTTKSSDRGMGMNVVQGIMHSHRGEVVVHSLPHEGAEVHLYFPLQSDRERKTVHALPMVDLLERGRDVIVFERRAVAAEVTAELIHQLGFQPHIVNNSEQFLALFQRQCSSVSFLLLDMGRSPHDAIHCFRTVRKLMPEMPVLLSSADSEMSVLERLNALPKVDYILKPYSAEELQERLDSLGVSVEADDRQ